MRENLYNDVKNWMYRNARNLELSLWQYFFEKGTKQAVVNALLMYQNEDGGFGHALEADNWNPGSTPISTEHAIKILLDVDFTDMSHPIYKGIWRYLESEKDLLSYGWRFTVPGNDNYPHAPWWNYSEEENTKEYYGVTASFSAFILRFGDKNSTIYNKAKAFADSMLSMLLTESHFGDMGLESYIALAKTAKELGFDQYEHEKLAAVLSEKINKAIERDTSKWLYYVVRPSNFIHTPDSPFYSGNEEIVKAELQYLIDTKPDDDVWPITWTWFDNMEKYSKQFYVSENWWKGYRAVGFMRLLRSFGALSDC